jgi:hypothetical protein
MTKQTSMLLLAAALAAGMPVAAEAQHQHGGGKPVAGPAARPAVPQIAPRMSAPAAPRMATPHMAPRMAAPRMAGPQAAPRMATPRMHSPHVSSQRMAIPHREPSASVNRSVQRQQFRQERELHHQRALQDRVRANAQAQSNAKAQSNIQAQSNVKSQSNLKAQSNLQSQQLNTRQQMRPERALRRREAQELRRLPPSQRAQRREEIRNAREQRALNRQQLAQPNALRDQSKAQSDLRDQSKAQSWRAKRLNGAPRVTEQAARQGRFASRFAQQANTIDGRNRWDKFAARQAWRRHHRAHFVAWFGPIFWPYAYSDIFDYTFWPYGYDDGYWAYAYDDFFDGLFWGEAGPPVEYAYAPPFGGPLPGSRYAGTSRRTTSASVREASVRELCRQPGSGITAWPFADIERRVGLNADQKQLLDVVRRASEESAAVFTASCPPDNAFPLTPPGRLDAMLARLEATLQAVQTVRPPLGKFYNSLSDEQKERFNQLGPKDTAANAEASVASQNDDTCRQPKPGLANLPIEKIEDVVNPNDAQAAQLSSLQDATNNAVAILQAACPNETPMTPPGRLDAMEKRLQAMVDAAKTVKPALESFYASLTSEQKARFNRIGRSLADAAGQSIN